MNRILLFPEDLELSSQGENYLITDTFRLSHLHQHLQAQEGQLFKVTLVSIGLANAEIIKIKEDSIKFKIFNLEKPPLQEINLCVGVSRPPTMKKILEHGTTMGITHFHIFCADLSEKSYLDAKIFKEKQTQKFLELGLSQSGKYYNLPRVSFYSKRSLLKNNFEQKFDFRFFLSPMAPSNLLDFQEIIRKNQPLTLAIGPERGFSNNEEVFFTQNGFYSLKISSSILRVEHALFTIMGQIQLFKL